MSQDIISHFFLFENFVSQTRIVYKVLIPNVSNPEKMYSMTIVASYGNETPGS